MANIIEITDLNIPELDIYARLSEVQLLHYYEPNLGIFIAESPNVIERALNAGYEPLSILVEKKHIESQAKRIIERCGEIPIYSGEFETLEKITGFKFTRGLLCAMRRKKLPIIEEICAVKRRNAVLENVMNPTNIGAIFRSAAALNLDAVLLTPASSDPLYRRATRVSMGTVFQIPWTFMPNEGSGQTPTSVEVLRKLGFKTAAMALREDSVSIDHPGLMEEDRLAIILGTEGDGLSDSTIEDADYTVLIPMSHGVDSLNVAAASAVAFWQLGNRK